MRVLPKISIVIPSYNKGKYIQMTLDSIMSQKYPDLEVIIQDGGSTDGTLEIIKKYAKRYPKVIKWVSKKDKGQVDAINIALKKTTGDILSFINADDTYENGALLLIGEYFRDNAGTMWLAGKGKMVDNNGKEISKLATIYKNFLLKINRFTPLLVVNYLMQPSVFINRDAYYKYGSFIGKEGIVMEYDMWLKMGRDKMPTVIDKNISNFRLTSDSFSTTKFKTVLTADMEIARKYTQNPFLLVLHKLNNWSRVLIVKLSK